MREVSVRFSAMALRLARASKSRGRRTVVRSIICQDISMNMSVCQYRFRLGSRVNRARQAWPAACGGLLHFNEKKPGPRGPGLKFASVGALANHLPEGKNCTTAVAKSGRIAATACRTAEQHYAKGYRVAQHGSRHASHALPARSSGQVTWRLQSLRVSSQNAQRKT